MAADVHVPKFGKTGFHAIEERSHSSEKRFQELLRSGFVIEHRFEKDVKEFDVHCLLNMLKRHRLFGRSFKNDLSKLYDDLQKAYGIVKDTHNIRHDLQRGNLMMRGALSRQLGKNMKLLADYQFDIIRQEDKILTDLEVGYHELKKLARRVELLKSDEMQILKWVKTMFDKNPALVGVMRMPLTEVATEIQGALHKIYPLFDVVSKAYDEKLLKRVKDKISVEVNKIDEFLKADIRAIKTGTTEPTPEISFEAVLADIALIQGTVDDIIKDVERIKNRDHKFCSKMSVNMKNIAKLLRYFLKHPEFEEFEDRKEAWRKKRKFN